MAPKNTPRAKEKYCDGPYHRSRRAVQVALLLARGVGRPVHVSNQDGQAKVWLTPSVHLALNVGLSALQLRQAQAIVEAHIEEIKNAWHRHFSR